MNKMVGIIIFIFFSVLFVSVYFNNTTEDFRSRLYPSYVAPYYYPYRYYYNGPYPFVECVENLFGRIVCGNASYLYY